MTGASGPFRRLMLWALLAIAVTAAFLAAFFIFADVGEALAALGGAPLKGWALSFAAMAAATALRFARLKTVYTEAPSSALFNASALHGAAVALLPGRVGEIVLPVALKRVTGARLLSGVGFLLLVRLLDVLALAMLGVFAGAVLIPQAPAGIAAAIAAAGFFSAPLFLRFGLLKALPRTGKIGALLSELADAAMRLSLRRLLLIQLETIVLWAAIAVCAGAVIHAVGLDASPESAVAAMVAGSFAFASPVNGVASVGPFEAAFAGALAASGHAFESALAAAAMLHISAVAVAIVAAVAAQALAAGRAGAGKTEPVQCLTT